MDVVPFEDRFAERAAALLAAAHAPLGEASPGTDLADPAVALAHLNARDADGPAVVALDGAGAVAGFMAASVTGFPGSPQARVRVQQHAAAPEGARAIYRRLYREISGRLTGIGCFEHTVAVSAAHREIITCLVELGFGIDQIKGVRPLTPPRGSAGQTPLRPARTEDLPQLLDLTLELQRFHALAPMLRPALIDLRAIRDDLLAAVGDERRLVLLAGTEGRVEGFVVVDPDSRFPGVATIGIAVVTASARGRGVGTALLSGVVDWAVRCGFRGCGTEWTSANLVSDAFWRGHGFVPARYTLARRIDPRVAWADSHLSYRDLCPEVGRDSAG
ncbi:hypothetical protein ADK64_38540 [Streptomyces sp. MMG1121]|nr:hypothetical protein ADK64_38540 [Streptomyces sp. MMG1121]